METLKEAAERVYKETLSVSKTSELLKETFKKGTESDYKFYNHVRSFVRLSDFYKETHPSNSPQTQQNSEQAKSDKQILAENRKEAEKSLYADPMIIKNDWNGDRIIRLGLLGDTHIGSKWEQPSYLHKAYDIFKSEGITDVYHAGDMTEGTMMRAGHQYECYVQGYDDILDTVLRTYPSRYGIKTSFITGNHDHSMIKHCGADIGFSIARERSDMVYLGASQANIYLTPNCKFLLTHPGGGSAYSLSYKTQKMIEAMSGGEKPHLFAHGHFHKSLYMFYRNVHAFQVGTTQAQTPFMGSMGLAASMGFWIIELHVTDEGEIKWLKQEFFPFYREIKDDYKNFIGYAGGKV